MLPLMPPSPRARTRQRRPFDIFLTMPVSNATDRDLAHRWFHALSDETRLQLLELLREGEQCVCDLTDALGAAQSRLSFHLKTLREAGLVTDRKEGRWVYYALNSDALEELAEFVSDLKPRATGRRLGARRCD
jgi:ArsR family transcriptional regulator